MSVRFFKFEQEKRRFDYEMRDIKLRGVRCVKDLGVNIASHFKISQQCTDAEKQKASSMLSLINFFFFIKI